MIEESRTSSLAPESFKSRTDLASCGEVVLNQGGKIPEKQLKCMRMAADGEGAELTVAQPTVEGDLIVTYHRVGPSVDGVELFIDSTRDQFGTQTWEHLNCSSSPQGVLDVTDCG